MHPWRRAGHSTKGPRRFSVSYFLLSPFTGDDEDLFACSDDDEYHEGNNGHADSMSDDDKDLFPAVCLFSEKRPCNNSLRLAILPSHF